MYGKNPIMKIHRSDDGSLDVHSIFYTIQGEGPHAGRAAVFVRLHGCSLACSWCDTEFDSQRRAYTPAALSAAVSTAYDLNGFDVMAHQPMIVITGGEPTRQNLAPFIELALTQGYDVQIETAGIHPLGGLVSMIGKKFSVVCSPKLAGVHPDVANYAIAFKYIIDATQEQAFTDGLPLHAVSQRNQPNYSVMARPSWLKRMPENIYVQPLDPPPAEAMVEGSPSLAVARRDQWRLDNVKRCIHLVKTFGYRMSIQTHKIMGVE